MRSKEDRATSNFLISVVIGVSSIKRAANSRMRKCSPRTKKEYQQIWCLNLCKSLELETELIRRSRLFICSGVKVCGSFLSTTKICRSSGQSENSRTSSCETESPIVSQSPG